MDAEAIAACIDGNPALREALAVVLERSREGRQSLAWEDVEDTLSSGQWGRLIERGLVVSRDEGFAVAAPAAATAALEDHADGNGAGAPDDGGLPEVRWSTPDKFAGVVAVVLFAGYSVPAIKQVVVAVDRVVLAPLDALLPFYAVVLLLSVVTGFYSTVLQANLMDYDLMNEYQERMQSVRDRLEAARERGDEDAVERLEAEQMEAMGDQLGMFKLQFRPMVWIMLITIPIFLWMRWKVAGHVSTDELQLVVPLVGRTSLQAGLLGPMPTWIVWYFVCSMGFRQVIQKALHLSPGAD